MLKSLQSLAEMALVVKEVYSRAAFISEPGVNPALYKRAVTAKASFPCGKSNLSSAAGRRLSTILQKSACRAPENPRSWRRVSSSRAEAGSAKVAQVDLEENVQKETEEVAQLFTPFQLGKQTVSHRVVFAPLTRCRSYGAIPQPSHAALYYGQRTTPGGFLIAEATMVNASGSGYPQTPGIWSEEQTEAWKPIVKAVHDKGGIFYSQIWHCGRQSSTHFQPNGAKPISSTNRRVPGQLIAPDYTMVDYSEPRPLETHEIPSLINDFVVAAKNAIAAGFDGVEIHGANGYIIDQFLKDGVNDRTDEYGGSLENRARFPLELADAVVAAVGAERVGYRLSPFTDYGDATTSDPTEVGTYMAQELSKRNIAYIHFIEPRISPADEGKSKESLWPFRKAFKGGKGTFLAAGGYKREDGIEVVNSGKADAAVYGRLFLANPDLPKRLQLNAPLNRYNRETFYTGDPIVGYTDYPFLEESHPDFAVSSE